uniref:Uncharacterized protein n=1 Tax=Rhizophora mucronata TaxID=61149 RepID=A0A2P2INP0_RHIMU
MAHQHSESDGFQRLVSLLKFLGFNKFRSSLKSLR